MWSIQYKPGFYIQGKFDTDECTVLYSPSGIGYDARWEAKSLQAAKVSITKFIKQQSINKYLERM